MRYLSLLLLALVVLDGVLVERRLRMQQPLDLSADSITFDGKLLHLKGHVRVVGIRWND